MSMLVREKIDIIKQPDNYCKTRNKTSVVEDPGHICVGDKLGADPPNSNTITCNDKYNMMSFRLSSSCPVPLPFLSPCLVIFLFLHYR